MPRPTLLLLPYLLLSAVAGFAEDSWPAFRGPHGNGHVDAPGLPTKWSETENIVWKTPIHGRAWSSPVVLEGKIWLTTATPDGHELSLLCVSAESGEVLLDRKLFDVAVPREIHKFNSYASPTPVIEPGRLYVSWGSYGLACIDTVSSELIWVRRDLECNHYRGPGSSPILFEDLLIQHYDGFDYQYVVALDKETGETVWKTDRPTDFGTDNGDHKKAYGTPIVIDVDGQLQLISPTSKGAFAYDPRTGKEIWRITYNGFSTACRPLYGHGLVFLSTGFSKAEMIAVRPTGTGDVTETHIAWIEKKAMPSKPSPLLIGDHLYTIHDQGVMTCLEAKTGEKVWQARIGGNYSASPLYANGNIYLFSEDGKATVVPAADEFERIAENELPEGFMASPAVYADSLILRTRDALYRIGNE